MKIYISDGGDRDVGINPNEMTIELNWLHPSEGSERIEMRERFRLITIQEFEFQNDTIVYFDDECPDCFNILQDNKCRNEGCISFKR